MYTGALAWYDLLSDLVGAVADELEVGPDGRPGRVCVVNGAIAWDDCECGQLVGTTLRWFYSDEFPVTQQPSPTTNCTAAYVVAELALSLLRCAPQPKGRDRAPSCEKLSESAQTVHRDAYTLRRTVACTLAELKDDEIEDYMIMDTTVVGPDGACVGSDILFFVALRNVM